MFLFDEIQSQDKVGKAIQRYRGFRYGHGTTSSNYPNPFPSDAHYNAFQSRALSPPLEFVSVYAHPLLYHLQPSGHQAFPGYSSRASMSSVRMAIFVAHLRLFLYNKG